MVWKCPACGFDQNDESNLVCACGFRYGSETSCQDKVELNKTVPAEVTLLKPDDVSSVAGSNPSFFAKYFGIIFFVLAFVISRILDTDFISIQPIVSKSSSMPVAVLFIPAIFILLPIALFKLKTHVVSNSIFILVTLPILYIGIKSWSNISFDQNPPAQVSATVTEKKEVRSWKSTSYVVSLKTNKSEALEMFLNTPKEFNALLVNDIISLHIKPGYWGNSWVQQYSKANP